MLTFAPCINNTRTASAVPLSAAVIKAVCTLFGRAVGVHAGLQQVLDECGIPVRTCEEERTDVVARRGLRVGASGDQQVGNLEIVPLRRPVQGSRTVGLGGIHVNVLREQRPDGFHIVVFYGIDEPQFSRCGKRRARKEGQNKTSFDGSHAVPEYITIPP